MYSNSVSYVPNFAISYRWYKKKNKWSLFDWSLFFINLNLRIGEKQKFFYSVGGWIMPYKLLILTEEVVINYIKNFKILDIKSQ